MGMEIKQLYYASVTDNIYTSMKGVQSKNGRVQIQIQELHAETPQNMLPWARPFNMSTGGSSSSGVSNIPEIGTNVWIFFSDENEGLYKKAFYIADGSLDNLNPHELFTDNVAPYIGSQAIYPNAKYYYFSNGICIGVDSSSANPEIFIYHPMASVFINAQGLLQITGPSGDTLGILMTQLITILTTLGTRGSPVEQTVNSATVDSLTALQEKFNMMLL